MPEKQPFTADMLLDLIRGKHAGTAWAVIPAVPNGTGGHKSRTADALAMSLWPSNGLHLHGFEIKVSRGDWMREIQDPLKADAFAAYCDFWWIVAPDGIIKLGEMPGSLGLMGWQEAQSLRDLKRAVEQFEKRTGIKIEPWEGEEIGETEA